MKTMQRVETIEAVEIIDFTRKTIVEGGRMGGAIVDEKVGKGKKADFMMIPLTQAHLERDPKVGDYMIRDAGEGVRPWRVMKAAELAEFDEVEVAASE